jgi:hypothetical protein
MASRKAPAPGTADPAVAGGTAIRAHDYLMHIYEGMQQLLRRARVSTRTKADAGKVGEGQSGSKGAAQEAHANAEIAAPVPPP